jgi:hypothetical protein
MFKLMNWAISTGLAKNDKDYFEKIGFQRTNISNVRRGHQSFSKDHIIAACKFTGANANWIFGIEPNMLRKDPKHPLDQIKQAVAALEVQLLKK